MFPVAALFYMSAVFINVCTTIFIKYLHINTSLSLYQIIAGRSILAVLLFVPILYKESKKRTSYNFKLLVFAGILASADVYLWHIGASIIPVNNATIMSSILPILITLFASIILREPIYLGSIMGILISFTAVNFMYKATQDSIGIGYAILALDFSIGALGFVLTKKLTQSHQPLFIVYCKILIMAPISLLMLDAVPAISLYNLCFVLLLTIIYIAERYCITKAYSLHDMSPLQPIRFSNIIFSIFLSYIILSEQVGKYQIIASLLVIIANLINVYWKNKIKIL